MGLINILLIADSLGAAFGIFGFLFMLRRFRRQVEISKKREEELGRRAYETAILKEIGDRIGYSLDADKIVEIISGSLGKLVSYSTVSYMIRDKKKGKMLFFCDVNESVSPKFIKDVKIKMVAAFSEMTQKPLFSNEVEEGITGTVLSEGSDLPIKSFFNLPIIISKQVVGIINVSSTVENLYGDEGTEVLYRIARQAADAVSKLQDVLESEKSRLSQAVQSLSDGLLMVDTNYELVLVNVKLTQLLNLISNPALFDIVNALSGNLDLRSLMEEALSTQGETYVREIIVKDKVLQVLASKVMDKDGQKAMGVVVLFHDVTDLKSLEKLRADFTSMMVHELRAPLTSIKSTVELMKKDFLKLGEEEVENYLNTVDVTSQTMLEVVNDLLDVAKMESGKFDVVCETAEVGEEIKERVESFKAMAAVKNIKISASLADNLPKGYFDRVRIRQVLNNVISNAIKFTQVGEVKVNADVEKGEEGARNIVVSVADTGIGIDPEEGSRLFLRFGQLVRSRRTVALKGSGLGLYIAKGIVEAWNGRIWYKSDGAGMGSTFYFTVPAVAPAQEIKNEDSDNFQVVVNKVAQA